MSRRLLTPARIMLLGGLLPGLVAAALLWAARPGGAVLRWRLERGQPFVEELTIEGVQHLRFMSTNADQKHSETFTFLWLPRDLTAINNWVVDRRLRRVQAEMSLPGGTLTYDSARDLGNKGPLDNLFAPLIGPKTTLALSPEGRLVDLELPKLRAGKGTDLLDHYAAPEVQRQLAEQVLHWLPPRAVWIGDTWEDDGTYSLGWMGSFRAHHRFTYEGRDAGLDRIKLETTLTYEPPAQKDILPFRVKSGTLQAEPGAGGMGWFDRARGRLDHAEMNLHLKGKLVVEVPGFENEMELDNQLKTTIKIKDPVPAAAKK